MLFRVDQTTQPLSLFRILKKTYGRKTVKNRKLLPFFEEKAQTYPPYLFFFRQLPETCVFFFRPNDNRLGRLGCEMLAHSGVTYLSASSSPACAG